jgi:hypothetical protein
MQKTLLFSRLIPLFLLFSNLGDGDALFAEEEFLADALDRLEN